MTRESIRSLCAAAILAIAVVALYAQTASFAFLRFDDPDYTFANAFVRNGLTGSGVVSAFADFRHGAVWMPVTWLSYMADIAFFGPGACPHHVVNVLLHLANAVLLLLLLRRLAQDRTSGVWLALAVGLWALHPQRVEAVAWIASRKELLWAFFSLLGLLAWRRNHLVRATVCCALACMSKPTAMVFPFLAILIDRIPNEAPRRRRWAYVPLFLLAVATGLAAVYSQTHPEGMAAKDLFYAGFVERSINALVAVGLYLGQLICPFGLHLDYRAIPGEWPLNLGLGLGALVVWAVLMGWLIGRLRSRIALWAFLWFGLALAPTLGIFGSFGEHARADRFLYVPMMALPLALAFVGERWGRRAYGVVAAFGLLFVGCSWPLIRSYRSDESAFQRTIACDADHGRALAHVGEARCAAGDLDAGIELLRHSRAVRPRAATDGKLAYALMRRGRTADWEEIRTVCAPYVAKPEWDEKGQALEALGTAELRARDWTAAATHLVLSTRAPARFYSAEDAFLKLAFAWQNGGRRAEALKLFERLANSTRADISARATSALGAIARSPNVLLFW